MGPVFQGEESGSLSLTDPVRWELRVQCWICPLYPSWSSRDGNLAGTVPRKNGRRGTGGSWSRKLFQEQEMKENIKPRKVLFHCFVSFLKLQKAMAC